ncbi:AraC family transcriptional regulator [Promicromonospora sp. NPDC023987]|uniref:AraC family transcriptional regulator n=1 Tax=Promicromonospora sp. NPDC023987 TaxID=3155360 RepID=UPI0033DE5494
MTTLRREWMPAGASASGPRGLWALVLTGAATLETAGGRSRVLPGGALLVDARTAHRLTADIETELVHGDLWQNAPSAVLPSPLVVPGFSERQRGVVALVTTCPLEVKCGRDLFAASYAGLIGAAMSALWLEDATGTDRLDRGADANAAAEIDAAADAEVAQVVAALAARPEEPWTLDGMAGLVHLSRSALTERFRRATGHSPMRMLRDVRMYRARTLLTDGHLPVTRVAFEVGYGSVAAFSRAFTADHGVSPLGWRAARVPSPVRPARPWVPSVPPGRSGAGRPQEGPAKSGGHRGDRTHHQQQADTVSVQ